MGTSINWVKACRKIEAERLADAVFAIRRTTARALGQFQEAAIRSRIRAEIEAERSGRPAPPFDIRQMLEGPDLWTVWDSISRQAQSQANGEPAVAVPVPPCAARPAAAIPQRTRRLTAREIEVIRERARELAGMPPTWPMLRDGRYPDGDQFRALMGRDPADPDHPGNWRTRLLDQHRHSARCMEIYARIREALWQWPEFASVGRGARAVLETVIELAREEAFPWHIAVGAEHVRCLARLSEGGYARAVRELECLAVSRPAPKGITFLAGASTLDPWSRPSEQAGREREEMIDRFIDRNRAAQHEAAGLVDERADHAGSQALTHQAALRGVPIAQWVLRYRRGVPWNRKRAAWWINHDLFMATGRLPPCFVMCMDSLSPPYAARNARMGGADAGSADPEGWAAMDRLLWMRGPDPPPGLRAALWNAE